MWSFINRYYSLPFPLYRVGWKQWGISTLSSIVKGSESTLNTDYTTPLKRDGCGRGFICGINTRNTICCPTYWSRALITEVYSMFVMDTITKIWQRNGKCLIMVSPHWWCKIVHINGEIGIILRTYATTSERVMFGTFGHISHAHWWMEMSL